MQPLKTGEAGDEVDIALYDRFAPAIFVYLYQQVSNQQDAEDLLLEVFAAALGNYALSNFPEERQLAWMRRVARNKTIDLYRRTALRAELPLEYALEVEDSRLSPEEYAVRRESSERLHKAVQQLSPLQQQLILLRYGKGLRLVEIAGIFERPEGTVRSILARTLRQLRTIYDKAEKGRGHIDETN